MKQRLLNIAHKTKIIFASTSSTILLGHSSYHRKGIDSIIAHTTPFSPGRSHGSAREQTRWHLRSSWDERDYPLPATCDGFLRVRNRRSKGDSVPSVEGPTDRSPLEAYHIHFDEGRNMWDVDEHSALMHVGTRSPDFSNFGMVDAEDAGNGEDQLFLPSSEADELHLRRRGGRPNLRTTSFIGRRSSSESLIIHAPIPLPPHTKARILQDLEYAYDQTSVWRSIPPRPRAPREGFVMLQEIREQSGVIRESDLSLVDEIRERCRSGSSSDLSGDTPDARGVLGAVGSLERLPDLIGESDADAAQIGPFPDVDDPVTLDQLQVFATSEDHPRVLDQTFIPSSKAEFPIPLQAMNAGDVPGTRVSAILRHDMPTPFSFAEHPMAWEDDAMSIKTGVAADQSEFESSATVSGAATISVESPIKPQIKPYLPLTLEMGGLGLDNWADEMVSEIRRVDGGRFDEPRVVTDETRRETEYVGDRFREVGNGDGRQWASRMAGRSC